VHLSGTVFGTGTGRTKKAAEQVAAEAAWHALSTADGAADGTRS
jgi:ribonuclease-3